MITKYQNNHSSIGTSFKYYLGNKDYSQKQVETQGHQKWRQFGTQGHWKCKQICWDTGTLKMQTGWDTGTLKMQTKSWEQNYVGTQGH